ncbi:TM2 domain-containing protein [Marinilabilia salmonicolor]|jgi:TM2 domain-containing membrane protein YozV|uniref:TM2 domain-containing protein n=1 Tax=Marinilabilia salmonicolor TaxID=989 RepID=A0A2T0XLE1_9BACT|nr:TM2 domain-containing protein [Marinilabilia salmonicolor]PRY99746.1 TM2 domain-containing protein [Marinilabilia salmonicolor]RCW37458.1 TM2 domain-containing protein [Marinilabilia salmonicolor]
MKKLLIVLTLVLGISAFTTNASASYTIDDAQIENLFATATATTFSMVADVAESAPAMAIASASGGKDPLIAILLDFFLGGFGIHRFYLGTKVMTGIGYILTCGGIFGLMPLIDLIVLAVNWDDISAYVDNPKFFMW